MLKQIKRIFSKEEVVDPVVQRVGWFTKDEIPKIVTYELMRSQKNKSQLSLAVIHFDCKNKEYSNKKQAECDRWSRAISQLVSANTRKYDIKYFEKHNNIFIY